MRREAISCILFSSELHISRIESLFMALTSIHKWNKFKRRSYFLFRQTGTRKTPANSNFLHVLLTMSFLRPVFRAALRPQRLIALPKNRATWQSQLFAVQRAAYSASAGLSSSDIQTRILDVLKSFEKVDPSKASSIEASLYLCIAEIFFIFYGS